MDLVGVIEILLIALIQIALVRDSCQASQTNVPFKTSFVSSSDYSIRRNVGALISLPLSNVETPHQPEVLMSGPSFEPTFHEQSFLAIREPISSASNTREEVSLNPSNQVQNVNSDYQGGPNGNVEKNKASSSSPNYSQEPVLVVEVQGSRQSQQPEEQLINTHYSQVEDLFASPSAEMSHNASHTNQSDIKQIASSNTTSKPIITTTIQPKLMTDNSAREPQETTSTVGPSSSTVQTATLLESTSHLSSTTASTTTTTTTTTTTSTTKSPTTTSPSSTTIVATESLPITTSPLSVTTTAAINRSTTTAINNNELYSNTTVIAQPESSTALVSNTEPADQNMSYTRLDRTSPQTSQSVTQTTHVPPPATSRTTDSTLREVKNMRDDNTADSDRSIDQEMFLPNRSSASIYNRAHICKFSEPNCGYLVAAVPVLDRWNPGQNDSISGQNNNHTRVVNEFVFVPEDSGLNFEDPSYITRKSGTKDIEPSSLKAEHRTIDNEGETTSNLSDDIELDYTNPDSGTTRSEPFVGKSATDSILTKDFKTSPRFNSTSTTRSAFSPTSSSLSSTTSETTSTTSQTRLPSASTSQISPVKNTLKAPMTTPASTTTTSTTTTTTTTAMKLTTLPVNTAVTTTKRTTPLQPSLVSSTSTNALPSKPTTRVTQSTSYTVRVSSSRPTSMVSQTTPNFRVEEILQTTRKPAIRLNQKFLRINDQSSVQLLEAPQAISRFAVSSTTTAPITTISISMPSMTSTPTATSKVSQSTSSRPVIERIPQEKSPQVRTRVSQQAPISRRPKASSNLYGDYKQFLSEPIRDLRRKSPSAVGSNFSPSFNGADDEETKILTRYSIPSQLSRLTASKSSTETKRSTWSNQQAGTTINTTNNHQNPHNKFDRTSPSEKLAFERRSSPTNITLVVSKDHLLAEIDKNQQHNKHLQVQTMTNMLLDDKQFTRQAQASLTVMAREALDKSDQVVQSQPNASMHVSSFYTSPIPSPAEMEKFEAPKVEDNYRSFGLQSNLSNNLNVSQVADKRQLPTTTSSTIATTTTTVTSKQSPTTERIPSKRNAGEVMTLIASSPNLGSVPAQPVVETFSIIKSIGQLNGDPKEASRLPQQYLHLKHQQLSLKRPDQQVDKIIDLLTSDLAAEKSRSSTTTTTTTSTTPRSAQSAKVELIKPVRRLIDEVDDFEGSIEDQLEKDALHSKPQKAGLKTTSAPMASKRSNAYTKTPRQNPTIQHQDSGKWIPSAEDAAGSGSDIAEGGGGSGNLLPGRPGIDYPIHWQVPKTSFDCRNYELSGFYADIESDCQAYHSCHKGRGGRHTFLCPNGTLFSQELLTCDWWYNVECSASKLYLTNDGDSDNPDRGTSSVGAVEQGSRSAANELRMAA